MSDIQAVFDGTAIVFLSKEKIGVGVLFSSSKKLLTPN